MKQNELLKSQEINQDVIEHIENVINWNTIKVIVLHSITSKNYISEIDKAAFIANIINEFTHYIIFESDQMITSDVKVIYHDQFKHQSYVSMKQVFNGLDGGLYISFITGKQNSYKVQLLEAMKIIKFIQSIINEEDLELLYERTIDWIEKNIEK